MVTTFTLDLVGITTQTSSQVVCPPGAWPSDQGGCEPIRCPSENSKGDPLWVVSRAQPIFIPIHSLAQGLLTTALTSLTPIL